MLQFNYKYFNWGHSADISSRHTIERQKVMSMVTTKRISLKCIDDYKKELAPHVPPSHIDRFVIEDLERSVGLRCKSIVIEYPYYESDYLSNYYIFYSQKLQQFSKSSCRLLLFSDEQATDLIGYVSLRPTCERTRCGRTYLEPQYLMTDTAHIVLSDCKVHFRGAEAVLRAFPHMKQEGDVSVCAHVALWSVMRSFTNRFHRYPELRLGDLVSMIHPNSGRPIPSKGLTPTQISDVLLSQGFSPIIREKPWNDRHFTDEIFSYIESGVPLIGFIRSREHAVTIIGHGEPAIPNDPTRLPHNYFELGYQEDGTPYETNVIMASKFIQFAVINDDNAFPYRRLDKDPRMSQVGYSLHDIEYAVIPLYPRIQLVYNDVREKFLGLVQRGIYNWAAGDKLISRIFLTSSNTYREYVREQQKEFGVDLVNIVLDLEMPKFIWCVEVSNYASFQRGEVNAIILIDSTCATINPDPFLLVTMEDRIKYKSDAIYAEEYNSDTGTTESTNFVEFSDNISLFSVPAFHNNLEEVHPYGET